MKRGSRASVVAAGLLAAMLPGAAAGRSFDYWVDAGCMDGGPGPQFMDISGVFPSLDAWGRFAREMERDALPDTGELDGRCSPGTIQVLSIEALWS